MTGAIVARSVALGLMLALGAAAAGAQPADRASGVAPAAGPGRSPAAEAAAARHAVRFGLFEAVRAQRQPFRLPGACEGRCQDYAVVLTATPSAEGVCLALPAIATPYTGSWPGERAGIVASATFTDVEANAEARAVVLLQLPTGASASVAQVFCAPRTVMFENWPRPLTVTLKAEAGAAADEETLSAALRIPWCPPTDSMTLLLQANANCTPRPRDPDARTVIDLIELRAAPDAGSAVVAQLPRGATLKLLEARDDDWSKVQVDAIRGFVPSRSLYAIDARALGTGVASYAAGLMGRRLSTPFRTESYDYVRALILSRPAGAELLLDGAPVRLRTDGLVRLAPAALRRLRLRLGPASLDVQTCRFRPRPAAEVDLEVSCDFPAPAARAVVRPRR